MRVSYMPDDILWQILRNHYLITEAPFIQWYMDDLTIAEAEASLDLKEATESAKFCNLDHYFKTRGWIA